jgi:YYY domain-containing protein
MIDILQIWVLVEALGLLCLPITVVVCHNLPDRGWAFSKTIGVAILSFCVWLPLICWHTLPYSREFILGTLIFLVLCSIFGYWRMYQTIGKVIRKNSIYVILTEIVFFSMVLLLGCLRSFKPDIRSFEMFMDEGFVAAIMRSPHLPPNDMWYAGHSINYYYYTHFVVATLAKLIGQSPSIIFNTGISMYFGLTAVNLFGLTSNIVAWARHCRQQAGTYSDTEVGAASAVYPPLLGGTAYGLLSLLTGLILGNLATIQQWWQRNRNIPVGSYDWFSPSRVIDKTINEFPAFSFLLSDFHAHVQALAFTILAAGLAFNLLLEKDGVGLFAFGRGWQIPLTLLTTALIAGGLFAMNGWDMPTYLGLTLICILLQQWISYNRTFSLTLLIDSATAGIMLAICSFILFIPYYLNFNSPSQGLGLVPPLDRSSLTDEFLIYGLFLFLFVSLLLISAGQRPLFRKPDELAFKETRLSATEASSAANTGALGDWMTERKLVSGENTKVGKYRNFHKTLIGIYALLIINTIVLFLFQNGVTLVIMVDIALIGGALTFYHLRDRGLVFTLLLGTGALFLVAFCEVVFLRDAFADNFPRMNTVFKFYFQAWALLSIASGCGMYFLWTALWPLRITRSIGHTRLRSEMPFSQTPRQARLLRRWIVGLVRQNARWYQIFLLATKGLWLLALLLLLIASMAYPVLAPPARLQEYNPTTLTYSLMPGNSVDGLNYLQNCRPPDPDLSPFCTIDVSNDYYAIRWINSHIQGDPVIVEGVGNISKGYDYSLYSRISTFTGLPTLMGWIGHEEQWRLNWLNNPDNAQSFWNQIDAVNTIYISPNPQQVLTTMKKYQAVYLYVGPLERLWYTQENYFNPTHAPADFNLDRFGQFMDVVYLEHGVTIYKMRS